MNNKEKKDFRIIFMGTPDFAVESLKLLVENNFNVVGVITSPDKPAGRGQKINQSAIKKYAVSKKLNILQPSNLKDPLFHKELKKLSADIQIIVAFRMLPESVWNMPKLGSINLHGSLLPQYRGAAPINWAVINGEEKTGVSTFFLKHEIDTGNLLFQEEITINPNDNTGIVHDKMMKIGAQLLIKTAQCIINNDYSEIPQETLVEASQLKHAPKIFKADCKINWSKNINDIHNHIRGLSPYPAAWTELKNKEKTLSCKIFKTEKIIENHQHNIGTIISDNKTFIHIAVNGGYTNILEFQVAGKKRMSIRDFLTGFKNINDYSF